MKVIHGTWVPQEASGFLQEGGFFIWIETPENTDSREPGAYSVSLSEEDLKKCLIEELGLTSTYFLDLSSPEEHYHFSQIFFLIPGEPQRAFCSFELIHCLGGRIPQEFSLEYQKISCLRVLDIPGFLRELCFKLTIEEADILPGRSLLFWRHYVESFQEVILRDQYIPVLKYHKKAASKEQALIMPAWEIVSEDYEKNLDHYTYYMPQLCRAGFEPKTPVPAKAQSKAFYKKKPLLRHFSENLLTYLIHSTSYPNTFRNKIIGTPLSKFISPAIQDAPRNKKNLQNLQNFYSSSDNIEEYKQLEGWKQRITHTVSQKDFHLAFQLQEPQSQKNSPNEQRKTLLKEENKWKLNLLVVSQKQPSFKRSLEDYWGMKGQKKVNAKKILGEDFERNLLLELGIASRIYSLFMPALNTSKPSYCFLSKDEAWQFLKEQSWVLQEAGYKVIIPSWYTPEARQKAKIRMKVKPARKKTGNLKSYFSIESIINYNFELSIGSQKNKFARVENPSGVRRNSGTLSGRMD